MLFKTERDWKTLLSIADEKELSALLEKAKKYRGAYKNADDVKIAQLWCAILELRKENLILEKKLKRAENLFELITQSVREQERNDIEILRSLEKL